MAGSLLRVLRVKFSGRPAPEAEAADEAPERATPLVPADSIAGRSLVIVIAIMTFLAALAAGGAALVADASADWRKEAAREVSVQLRAVPGRDIEADIRKTLEVLGATPGIKATRAYTRAESEALLAPWLGEGLDLAALPVPRMIVVTLDAEKRPDLEQLKRDLARATPAASLDDHRIFVARLGDMARALVGVAAAIFALIVVAMAIAVASATSSAVATNREIVEVLHIVGAADSYIAREFQLRFQALGLRGALLGGAAALAFFALAQFLARRFAQTPGGDQMAAIFGDFGLGARGFAIILVLSAAIAILTGVLSRATVVRHLRQLR